MLLGILLAVAAMPVSDNKKKSTGSLAENTVEEETLASQSELETKLASFLSEVKGVGKVRVILMTGEESQDAVFSSSGETRVTGVLICAQGAGDSVTECKIQEAVMALFQIEAHKIKVMKMK